MENFNLNQFNKNITNYVNMAQQVCGAPQEFVFAAVMSVISTSVQGRVNISLHANDERTISLAFIAIGDSGTRKTSTWLSTIGIIENYEIEKNKDFSKKQKEYNILKKIYKRKQKMLNTQIDEALKSGLDDDDLTQIAKSIESEAEPEIPTLYRLVFNDTSGRALDRALAKHPSVLLGSHEASSIFSRQGQKLTDQFTQIWDGTPFRVDRANQDSEVIQAPRVTFLLMMQTSVFRNQFKYGNSNDELGLLARFFISHTDRIKSPEYHSDPPESAIRVHEEFQHKIQKLLDMQHDLNLKNEKRARLSISIEGRSYLLGIVDDLRGQSENHGPLKDSRAMIEKFYELTARMAACIHAFNDPELKSTEINITTIKEALSVTYQYLKFHQGLLGRKGKLTETVNLISELKYLLIEKIFERGNPFISLKEGHLDFTKDQIRKFDLDLLKRADVLNSVLEQLKNEDIIVENVMRSDELWNVSIEWVAEKKGISNAYSGAPDWWHDYSYIRRPRYQRKDRPLQ